MLSCSGTHKVYDRLVAAQEDSPPNRNPRHTRRKPSEEGPYPLIARNLGEDMRDGHALLGQHDPRLEHVERRRQPCGDATRYAAVEAALHG